MKYISSLQNSLVKEILALQSKSKVRKERRLFVCEGVNEIRLCKAGNYKIHNILFCSKNIELEHLQKEINCFENEVEFLEVSSEVFSKISYREDVYNALAIVSMDDNDWSKIESQKNGIYLVAEMVEKPGNLGALLRTADAAGITAVLLADPLCDLYNPNVIRSSVGCVFTVPVFSASTLKIQQFLLENNIRVYTTFMEGAISVWNCDFSNSSAVVVGTESTGLTNNWRNDSFTNINIPMFGKVDSLNVSVAASLLMFEAIRQRNK